MIEETRSPEQDEALVEQTRALSELLAKRRQKVASLAALDEAIDEVRQSLGELIAPECAEIIRAQ